MEQEEFVHSGLLIIYLKDNNVCFNKVNSEIHDLVCCVFHKAQF